MKNFICQTGRIVFKPEIEMPVCEVCEKNQAIRVCCVPGVPISCAYCRKCLDVNAHPWWILVADTICLGGLENAADWWKRMVEDTCQHLGRTIEEFNREVQEGILWAQIDFDSRLSIEKGGEDD